MEIYEFVTMTTALTGVLVALAVGLWQARIARKSIQLDHERRKIQAAMEYMDKIHERYNSLNNELRNKDEIFTSRDIGQDGVNMLFNNVELRDKVRELLDG